MATGLATQKSASKSEAYLQRKFAELCARIKRVDVVTHLLALALTIFTYALVAGCFDWFAGSSTSTALQATRWSAFGLFLAAFGFLAVLTFRSCLRHVSPYYVAQQIEQGVPGAKNSLINWLDLHDEGLPSAFQKNLSTRAAEQLEESDTEQAVPRRKAWILLGVLGVPTLGLLVLLILGPLAFLASMQRAFLPFYAPPPAARTQIVLLQPEGGDAEVGPGQAITFAAKIEGRIPTGKQAPTLHYRWNADDDFLTLPLHADGAGVWSTQLLPGQLRAGVTCKISAGDAETREFQVRTRPPAHVSKFEIVYTHKPFRNRKPDADVFPNERGTGPIIHGPVGSEVELTIHASRPVKAASVQINSKLGKKEPPIRMLAGNPQAFACRFTLEQPGTFRIAFSTLDGEDNTDRQTHPIHMSADDTPQVVLTQPGADVSLPENGTLELAGSAVSALGVKSMTLHMRIIDGPDKAVKLQPLHFRDGKSLQFADGTFPREAPFQGVVALDQLRVAKGIHHPPPGSVIEYWLEATDCADYPSAAGNVGRSLAYKVTLLAKPKDTTSEEIKRKQALDKQAKFDKKQDQQKSQKNPEQKKENPQQTLNQIEKDQKDANKKLDDAQKDQKKNQERGGSKGADEQNAEKKDGPQHPGEAPQPKPAPMSPPDDAGDKKDQGAGQGGSGESRDSGAPQMKQDDSAKGEKKEGSKEASTPAKDSGGAGKQEPAGGARDGGPTGKGGPETPPAKDNAPGEGAPMPSAKNSNAGPPQGTAKGIEKNGPELPSKDQKTTQPPDGHAKAGKMPDPGGSGDAKQGPSEQANSGQARGDDSKSAPKEPSWNDIAQNLPNLPGDDKAGADAGKALADTAKNAPDPRMRDIAKEILAKNGRDPKTGQKAPNPHGTLGKSEGISDDIKAAAANREFAARIGQMQLDDWKKRLSPDLLKKAGMSEADWQRYVKNQEAYDTLVRQLNALAAKDALKHLSSGKNAGSGIRAVDGPATTDTLRGGTAGTPAELLDAIERAANRDKK